MIQKKYEKFVSESKSMLLLSPKMALMVGTGMMLSGYASAQANPELSNRLLQKIEEQDQKIAERDQVIDDLMRRVKQLEGRDVASTQPRATVANAPAEAPKAVASGPSMAAVTPAPATQQQAQSNTAATQKAASGLGSFEVDENLAQRALERTLVQTGALLLPVGMAEVQPYVTYTRRESDLSYLYGRGIFVENNAIGLDINTADASIRRNEFDMGAVFLAGLPFESQFEFRLPYRSVNQSTVYPTGVVNREIENTGNSIGDVSVGLAKTLYHETEWLPDLIGRVTWDSATGDLSSNDVRMGGGFNDFIASLTALKRQDPLAFTARIAYQASLERQDVKPGDQASLSIGATLAASPQTSLSVGLQQTYVRETRVSDVKIQGSDYVSSAFTLGASSTIGRNLFFSATGGIGLTESSPDYFFNLTVPFRFDMPSYKKSSSN